MHSKLLLYDNFATDFWLFSKNKVPSDKYHLNNIIQSNVCLPTKYNTIALIHLEDSLHDRKTTERMVNTLQKGNDRENLLSNIKSVTILLIRQNKK